MDLERIDKSKLKRDYEKQSLYISKNGVNSERPFKEDLEYLYIDLNMTQKDLSKYFNINIGTVKTILKEYSIKKPLNKIIENTNKTILKNNYGKHYFQTDEFKQKIKETNMIKRGTQYHQQTREWKIKIKQVCNKKYGVDNVFQLDNIKRKIQKTTQEKYNKDYFVQTDNYKQIYQNNHWNSIVQQKKFNTLKNKRLLGKSISNIEIELLNMLQQRFPTTVNQYYSCAYPWKCDFYIPEIDTYIEYNGFWMHGKEPFNNTFTHQALLNEWKNKLNNGKLSYKRAIKIWTEEDVRKRNWAIEHKLKWFEFFSKSEFIDWMNNYEY